MVKIRQRIHHNLASHQPGARHAYVRPSFPSLLRLRSVSRRLRPPPTIYVACAMASTSAWLSVLEARPRWKAPGHFAAGGRDVTAWCPISGTPQLPVPRPHAAPRICFRRAVVCAGLGLCISSRALKAGAKSFTAFAGDWPADLAEREKRVSHLGVLL